MEEILASIRRIISEEDEPGAPKGGDGAATDAEPQAPAGEAAAATAVGKAAAGHEAVDQAADGAAADGAAARDGDDAEPDDDVLELTQMVADDGSIADMSNTPDDTNPPAGSSVGNPSAGDEELEFAENDAPPVVAPAVAPKPAATPAPTLSDDSVAEPADEDAAVASEQTASAASAAFSQLDDVLRHGHLDLGDGQRTLEDIVREVLRPILKQWVDENLPGLVERIVAHEIERMVSRGGRR